MAAGLLSSACTTQASPPQPTPTSTTVPTSPATPSASASSGSTGGSLRFGLGEDPRSIDPRFADDEAGLLVVDALFDSLTALGRNFFPVPSVATSWEASEDLTQWTFTIDTEARYHDGRRVRAEDFVRAFNRIAKGTVTPRSFQAHLLRDVVGWEAAQEQGLQLEGVAAIDDVTLVLTLQRPIADLPLILAHPTLAPVPPAADTDPAWPELPIGNGPYAMVEPWAHNQFIRLARADPTAGLDEVLFRIYADDPGHTQQFLDFGAGQLHVAQVPPAELAEAERRHGTAGDGEIATGVLDGPLATTYHYGFDTTRPPFDLPEVRQAVSLVIDRVAIADEVMLDTRRPATALLPAGVVGHVPGSCTFCRHDPDAARQILAEAGIELDSEEIGPIRLLHTDGTTHAAIAGRIAAAIEQELGLTVEVVSNSLQGHATAISNGEGHLFRLGWSSEHPLPSSFLVPLFHSRSRGGDNVMGFSDEEVDALLDSADAELDRRRRLDLSAQATARLEELLPIVPLLSYRLLWVVSSDVEGFRMDALGRVDLSRVSLATAS